MAIPVEQVPGRQPILIRAAPLVVVLVLGCVVVAGLSYKLTAESISKAISDVAVLFTTIYLVVFSALWASSGYIESKILGDYFKSRGLVGADKKLKKIANLAAFIFGLLLAFAIFRMYYFDQIWIYLCIVFTIYTAVDLMSWQLRRWFLEDLVKDSVPLAEYYLDRPHIRRLVLQCACPLMLLLVMQILQCSGKNFHGVGSCFGSNLETALFRFGPPTETPGADLGTNLRNLAYGVLLACAIYSEAVIAVWRRDMKLKLSWDLNRAIWWDKMTKIILFPFFMVSLLILIVPVTNAILNRFHTVVLTAYSMGIPAATLSVILVGVAAFGFKMYSRFFYGFFEVVVGIIFMHRIISSTTPGSDGSLNPADIVQIMASLFIFVRGVENTWEGSLKRPVDARAIIENFGRARVFQ